MGSPFENLRSLTKQIMQFLSQTKKCYVDQLLFPKEILATLEIFHIPNFLLTLAGTKLQLSAPLEKTNNMKHYISSILDTGTNKTMIAFTDGSTQSDPRSPGSGVIIKKQGRNSTPIKTAKAAKCIDLPGISGNWMVKSKLPSRSGCSLEAVEAHPSKGAIKFFKVFFLAINGN